MADTLTSASVIRWTVKRGCQFREVLGWADADGVALDLDGAAFTMKARRSAADATVAFEPTVATTATDGEIAVSLTAAQTEAGTGIYVADLQVELGDAEPTFVVRVEFNFEDNTNLNPA